MAGDILDHVIIGVGSAGRARIHQQEGFGPNRQSSPPSKLRRRDQVLSRA
jgi:hypothetical protein